MGKSSFLDTVLIYIKQNEGISLSKEDVKQFTKEENELLKSAVVKLEKDGYLYSTGENAAKKFHLSYDGFLALEDKWLFMFSNQPYKNKKKMAATLRIWQVAKIIIAVLNALAILYLSYLSVKH